MLAGNEILENEDINNQLGEPLSEIKKEKWIRTKYKIFQKPKRPEDVFEG